IEWRLALRAARVTLEEQSFDRPERRDGRTPPAGTNGLRRILRQFAEPLVLIAFDRLDDRRHQPVAGTEMVNQHAVAGPDLSGEIAQRSSCEPAIGRRLDDAAEQVVAAFGHLARACVAVLDAAAACSLRCFSPAASIARYRRVSD